MAPDRDYAAVPLDEAANAPIDLLPEPTRPPTIGELPMRGLPSRSAPGHVDVSCTSAREAPKRSS